MTQQFGSPGSPTDTDRLQAIYDARGPYGIAAWIYAGAWWTGDDDESWEGLDPEVVGWEVLDSSLPPKVLVASGRTDALTQSKDYALPGGMVLRSHYRQ